MKSDRNKATARRASAWTPWRTRIALYALLIVMALPFVMPLWWLVSASFKPASEIFRNPPSVFPENPTLEGYVQAFTLAPLAQQYGNSLYIAALVTIGTVLVSACAGYAFARIRFRGANVLFFIILAGLMIPAEVTIVPLFRMASEVGMLDTHWPLILIPVFGGPSVLCTFIMRQFFLGLPTELEEAARLDGLGVFGTLRRVAFPLAGPAIASVAILSFLKSWNLYLEPLVFLKSQDLFTLPLALTQYDDGYQNVLWTAQLAATTTAVVPLLIVFLFAQRHFVEGLARTGMKG
ncbi:carbohydrate ABC transporter permease [Microbacterium xanthum]|uniref:carbohydrate ABC transporter permease n=1 Tax=Microbacterium xanthum TaxID=3079794 RepID=UPI002AD3EF79|nr:carbohydrate ABC transporter permease [Microbacterium sp. KSW-48]MDZ8170660.1 carbohydrate ABC transporter permease [Microbacterium sp. KSW-48]